MYLVVTSHRINKNNNIKKNKSKNNNNKNNSQRKKKGLGKGRAQSVPQIGMNSLAGLSHCALKYATAISAPWDPEAQGCCIPTFPSKASQKVTTWSRGTATIGSNGVGFVCVAPTLANNTQSIFYSTSAYAGATLLTGGGGVVAQTVNAPYTSAQLTSAATDTSLASGRLVSCALGYEYSGTLLNRGGINYELVEPNHYTLDGFTPGQMSSFQECCISSTDSKRHWITTAGIDSQEVQYPEYDAAVPNLAVYPFCQNIASDTSTSVGAPIMAVMFTGTPGNTFYFELVQHAEYIGSTASAMATPTHSDARGFEMVNTASNRLPQLRVANPNTPLPKLMGYALREIGGELMPYAKYGAKMIGATALTALGGYLGGPAGAGAGGSAARMIMG